MTVANATMSILTHARREHSALFYRVNPFSALFAVFLNIFMSILAGLFAPCLFCTPDGKKYATVCAYAEGSADGSDKHGGAKWNS